MKTPLELRYRAFALLAIVMQAPSDMISRIALNKYTEDAGTKTKY